MKRRLAIAAAGVGLAALIALGFVAGRMSGRSAGETRTANRRVLYWVDPMHPAYKSDKPGIAPDCGMALEPVYESESGAPGGLFAARIGLAQFGKTAADRHSNRSGNQEFRIADGAHHWSSSGRRESVV